MNRKGGNTMKKVSVILLVCLAAFSSCKNKVKEPDSADFSWYTSDQYLANMIDLSKAKANPDTIRLTDAIYFVANSTDADSYVVWPGEAGFNIDGRDLPDSLKGDTVNNVSAKSHGVVLSTLEAGRYVAKYSFSKISEKDKPYVMYGTARNYNYKTGEYKESTSKGYPLVVIDDQVDLWGSDPYATNATDYRIIVKAWAKGYTPKPKMIKGTFEVTYEDVDAGIQPGVTMKFKTADGITDLDSCQFVFKANNCIPVVTEGSIKLNTSGAVHLYYWTVNLSKGPVTLTLKSQSAADDAKSGDPLTKDYFIKAVLE